MHIKSMKKHSRKHCKLKYSLSTFDILDSLISNGIIIFKKAPKGKEIFPGKEL